MKVINALFEELETTLEQLKQGTGIDEKLYVANKCAGLIKIINRVSELSFENIATETPDKWGCKYKRARKWL